MLLISTFLVLMARLNHFKKFSYFIKLPFTVTGKDVEEEFNPHGLQQLFDVLLTLNSYITIALACFLFIQPAGEGLLHFFRLIIVFLGFFLLKNLLQLFIAWLFDQQEYVVKAQNIGLAYRTWLGVVLLPLLFLLAYVPGAQVVSKNLLPFLLLACYIVIFYFSSSRMWKMPAPSYYKILYICALEIAPFFFLVNWLISLWK